MLIQSTLDSSACVLAFSYTCLILSNPFDFFPKIYLGHEHCPFSISDLMPDDLVNLTEPRLNIL